MIPGGAIGNLQALLPGRSGTMQYWAATTGSHEQQTRDHLEPLRSHAGSGRYSRAAERASHEQLEDKHAPFIFLFLFLFFLLPSSSFFLLPCFSSSSSSSTSCFSSYSFSSSSSSFSSSSAALLQYQPRTAWFRSVLERTSSGCSWLPVVAAQYCMVPEVPEWMSSGCSWLLVKAVQHCMVPERP